MSGSFRFRLLSTLLLIVTLGAHGKEIRTSLKKALADKKVSLFGQSNGGYCNKGLTLELTNNSPNTMIITVLPGMLFRPEDSGIRCQPLILLGDEVITLNTKEKKSIVLQTFCGDSHASCPYKGIKYVFARQLDTTLVNVLRYAKANSLDPHLIQYAVWTFTNNHPLRTVYAHYIPTVSENFVKYIAGIRKMKVPHYFVEHTLASNANHPVIRHGQERAYVNMSWKANEGYRNVYVTVYKEGGERYKQVENNIISDKYGSVVVVELNLVRDKSGTYIVRLHDDANNILQEKTITLEPDTSF